MADGQYQRTCNRCQTTWLVPADIAGERPSLGSITSQMTSMLSANLDQQAAMKAHFQQLGAAAKCPHCGATSFTQQQLAESAAPALPAEAAAEAIPSAPPAAPMPPIPAVQVQRYLLNQKLLSLTGDFWIEDGQGNQAFEVSGELLSLSGTHVLKDLNGQPLYEISKSLAPHVHKTILIKKGVQSAATVQEAVFHLGGDKFKITLVSGLELTVHGDWYNREFQVKDSAGVQVIDASRQWFSIHDAYGIEITTGFEVPLGLAIVVALERVEAQEHGDDRSPLQNLLGGFGQF